MSHLSVETAVIDIKGRLNVKLAVKSETGGRLTESPNDQIQIELSLDEDKNGLDSNFTAFTYQITDFKSSTVEMQLEFAYPECISSF